MNRCLEFEGTRVDPNVGAKPTKAGRLVLKHLSIPQLGRPPDTRFRQGHPHAKDELLGHTQDRHLKTAPDEVMPAVYGAEVSGEDGSRVSLLGWQLEPVVRGIRG